MGKRGPNAKLQKNRAYYKRFVVKFKRRRQGKTDYAQRTKLIKQDKSKYNTQRYRLVARITNKDVVCQVVFATAAGDKVFASAYAHELPKYGLSVGLTNYAACYCTGLLLARRVNSKTGLDKYYEGTVDIDGEGPDEDGEVGMCGDFGDEDEKNPFKCYLDIGLKATTTGARIFGCLKGASDGGLDIPHNSRNFPGYTKAQGEDKEEGHGTFDAATHKKYIFGGHVANYMTKLQDEDEGRYKKQFARYIAAGIEAGDLEALYTKVHAAIRASPNRDGKVVRGSGKGSLDDFKAAAAARKAGDAKGGKQRKLTSDERRARVLAKIKELTGALNAAAAAEDAVEADAGSDGSGSGDDSSSAS